MIRIFKIDGLDQIVIKQDNVGEAFISSPTSIVVSSEAIKEIIKFLLVNRILFIEKEGKNVV